VRMFAAPFTPEKVYRAMQKNQETITKLQET
jgi:hypothetical protein